MLKKNRKIKIVHFSVKKCTKFLKKCTKVYSVQIIKKSVQKLKKKFNTFVHYSVRNGRPDYRSLVKNH